MTFEKWEALQIEWGKRLLEEYPDGIPENIDFEADGSQRFNWAAKGWSHFTVSSAILGERDGFEIGGKRFNYESFHDMPKEQHASLAAQTAKTAKSYWAKAKLTQMERDRVDQKVAEARRILEAQAEAFLTNVSNEKSSTQLDHMLNEAKSELRSLSASQEEERRIAQLKIDTTYSRLLFIERRQRLMNTIFGISGLVGIVLTIVFGILSL